MEPERTFEMESLLFRKRSSVPVVNGTVRYFPQTADTGLKLIITVTDSVGNSDTLIPVILCRPPLELGLTMNFGGKYTRRWCH